MKYGHFDDIEKEYVITEPQTPYPWINYLGAEAFHSLISNTAGGYSFYRDARLRRITRYRYNDVPIDNGGRYFYIHDGGDVWSPGWKPCRKPLGKYECRHGLGYTRITGRRKGIEASVLCFVPLGDDCEIQKVTLTNVGKTARKITLFSFVEFCLWNAVDDMTDLQRSLSTGEVEVKGSAIYHKTGYNERRDHYAFYSVNEPIAGYDTDRDTFMGLYNGFDGPDAVLEGRSRNSVALGWSPIASHSVDVTLEPGASKDLIFILGYVENTANEKWERPGIVNKKKAESLIARYADGPAVDKALVKLKKHWSDLLSVVRVETGDENLDRMVNIWNPYQCMMAFTMSRSASYFESGVGQRMGSRDANQDLLGVVHQIPAKIRQRLLDMASTQFEDGGDFNDDPLWLILAVASYLKETGDASILDEPVPFDSSANKVGPLFEHLSRSFHHVVNHLGPHGLPLIGRADWNEALNLNCFSKDPDEPFQATEGEPERTAESVLMAALFVLCGSEFVALCRRRGLEQEANVAAERVEKMRKNIDAHAWDGRWFLRAYDYARKKVGSHENGEGKIFIEPQGCCVMAGIGLAGGRAKIALESVRQYLDCPYGVVLTNPAFNHFYAEYGEISAYPKGYKENAGVVCHTNAWIAIAETILGNGDRAFECYRRIAPAYLEEVSDLHKTEPYVYAEMIAGKDASKPGEAKNSWLTSAAAWNFYAVTQYILGVRPEYDGLRIDPCVPKDWTSFAVTRKFRKAEYQITFENPSHVSKGVKQITVDGKPLDGTILPVFADGKIHIVTVIMG